MIISTRGILLSTTKFGESGLVARIFTEESGLQAFLIHSTSGKKAKIKPAQVMPLSLVNLVVHMKETREVQKISELEVSIPYRTIHTDIKKTTISLFLSEILSKVIRKDVVDRQLFSFLFDSFVGFDKETVHIQDFHIRFLIQLLPYLGIEPHADETDGEIFLDFEEGIFQSSSSTFSKQLNAEDSKIFRHILHSETQEAVLISNRGRLLDGILNYYSNHFHGFPELKSISVLREVMK